MARASTTTLLSLDRLFAIAGLDPLHSNQLYSATRPVGNCNDVLYQYTWQDPAQAGREEIANAIREAESMIMDTINYAPMPTWVVDERQPTVRLGRPELFASGLNVRGLPKSVKVNRGYFIAGGQRAKTLIAATVAVAYSDADGDGFKETVTATQATSVTDACQIHAYFTTHSGADAWELKPITVSLAAGVATVTFKRWQAVDPDLWDALDAEAIDGDNDANFITHIDLYRVYNDPSVPVQFLWEAGSCQSCNGAGCDQCEFITQYGCLSARDERVGVIRYEPATWDAATATFTAAEYSACREPDKLRLWYQAGYRASDATCDTVTMDAYWERTIAMLAMANIHGDLCNCTAVKTFFNWCQADFVESNATSQISYQLTQQASACPFGTRRGQVVAYQRCMADGRQLIR